MSGKGKESKKTSKTTTPKDSSSKSPKPSSSKTGSGKATPKDSSSKAGTPKGTPKETPRVSLDTAERVIEENPEDGMGTGENLKRSMLLLGYDWNGLKDGIVSVNRTLAVALARYENVKVYSTVLCHPNEIPDHEKDYAEDNNITLIYPTDYMVSCKDPETDIYRLLNEAPNIVFPDIEDNLRITHIVGHAPVSAEAALKFKRTFQKAKVILFYHVIPSTLTWCADRLPYAVPNDQDMLRMAEEADRVYSVMDRIHWHYKALFRNRSSKEICHRLFLPQVSETLFTVHRDVMAGKDSGRLLTFGYDSGFEPWHGMDIAACASHKLDEDHSKTATRPKLTITGAGTIIGKGKGAFKKLKEDIGPLLEDSQLEVDIRHIYNEKNLITDFTRNAMCILPSRAEPFGHVGLQAMSAGIPTLVSKDSAIASLISRLTSEPEYFMVPVTPTVESVRQDASIWRDNIARLMEEPQIAYERAQQLKMALKRDDRVKETYDNFVTCCLGGIRLKHEVTKVVFPPGTPDMADKELLLMRKTQLFMMRMMRQCWRLKHHVLTKREDLIQLLPGVDIPITDLSFEVTDKIEDKGRRITGVDKDTSSFIVYCPDVDALEDLWAMCDVINERLVKTIFPEFDSPILEAFNLKEIQIRTVMSGPEMLRYKNILLGKDPDEGKVKPEEVKPIPESDIGAAAEAMATEGGADGAKGDESKDVVTELPEGADASKVSRSNSKKIDPSPQITSPSTQTPVEP